MLTPLVLVPRRLFLPVVFDRNILSCVVVYKGLDSVLSSIIEALVLSVNAVILRVGLFSPLLLNFNKLAFVLALDLAF